MLSTVPLTWIWFVISPSILLKARILSNGLNVSFHDNIDCFSNTLLVLKTILSSPVTFIVIVLDMLDPSIVFNSIVYVPFFLANILLSLNSIPSLSLIVISNPW